MTKEEFKVLTGENPTDMFGQDWKNEMSKYEEGQCQSCREPLNNAEGYECTECQVDRVHQTQD